MSSQNPFESDLIHTSTGDLEITFLGHGSLMMAYNGKLIHIDPFTRVADYSTLPKADIIFITHEHRDHLDPDALKHAQTEQTIVILTALCAGQLSGGIVMKNGDKITVDGIGVEAVPAYNILNKRESGQPYHPKGDGNGYILTFGDTRIYVAGDTENIPEMAGLRNVDIAFLPMNLPYTMTPEMVADAARVIHPRTIYPYHYGKTDVSELVELLVDTGIEVRIRNLA